jgi:benzil reductase ((S)-benzoin forming)
VDVTDLRALEEFADEVSEQLGPIDLWINNAAVLDPIVPQVDLEFEELSAHLAVNIGGVLNGTKAFINRLKKDGTRGALVNISSGLAQKGRAGLSAYAIAKAGVNRMTEIVAVEEQDLLSVALAVAPGVIETGMQERLRSQDEDVLHDVEMFRGFDRDDAMYRPEWIASWIARWSFGVEDPEGVVVRVPLEETHA